MPCRCVAVGRLGTVRAGARNLSDHRLADSAHGDLGRDCANAPCNVVFAPEEWQAVREWTNRHQRTDKGFGLALGPDAVAMLATLLQQQGYRVKIRPSPWRLNSEQAAMQTALLDGWIEAALEIAPEAAGELAFWLKQRRHWIECGQSRLQIGHWDLWAWLD